MVYVCGPYPLPNHDSVRRLRHGISLSPSCEICLQGRITGKGHPVVEIFELLRLREAEGCLFMAKLESLEERRVPRVIVALIIY